MAEKNPCSPLYAGNRATVQPPEAERQQQLDDLIRDTGNTIYSGDCSPKMQGQIDALQSVRKLWCGKYLPMQLPSVTYTIRHRLCRDDAEALSLLDEATVGEHGGNRTHCKLDNVQLEAAPTGNSRQRAIRKLREAAPEVHAEPDSAPCSASTK